MIFHEAEKLPPCLCRLVARKGWKPKSHSDIAREIGLSRSYVSELSKKTTWAGVPINIVDLFAKSCGVDLLTPGPTIEYLRESKMIHTRRCSKTQKRFFAAIFASKVKKV